MSVLALSVLFLLVACPIGKESPAPVEHNTNTQQKAPTQKSPTSVSPENTNGAGVNLTEDHGERQGRRKEIIYGEGGAGLLLSDTDEQLVRILGESDRKYVYAESCNQTEMIWIDVEDKGNGIRAYLRNSRLYQLNFGSSTIETKEGIRFGTPVEALIEAYNRRDKLEEFTLMYTDGDFARDFPRYLVDTENGVAFKINHRTGSKKDEVWAIEIFDKNSKFAPNGCVTDETKFVKSNSLNIRLRS